MNLGLLSAGLVLGISAVGSGLGISIAGRAVIGAWKKCYLNNKPAPMTLIAFGGAPLTQTFYGFILGLLFMKPAALAHPENGALYLGIGIASAFAIAGSAIAQGQAGAAGADATGETGKGFVNYMMIVGICETVAIFAMVLSMISLN
ncbi:ATP synthase subunit K [Treponema primitia ZAS-2]|uniref:ATP synthase subunit K n=1 Tax=Treponema primitia (strain ATCC BAA-887 / DSM 12427 / ZAS-2) TaxID=545694 RepID=F5YR81_TREPZ|nr:ATP synthase subunit K [Treponema primitia]AEF83966.1 ATP synthase subunit K [Treponema primitia ZAS-2]